MARFHEVQHYLDRVPLEIQIFGVGMNLRTLLAASVPLALSGLFTIVRMFV